MRYMIGRGGRMHVLTCSVSAETVRRILRHYVVHEFSAAGDPYTLLIGRRRPI